MGLFTHKNPRLKLYEAYKKADFLDDDPSVVSQAYFLNMEAVCDLLEDDIVGIQLFEDHLEISNPDPDSVLSFPYSRVKDVKYGEVDEVVEKEHSIPGRAFFSGCCLFCLFGIIINLIVGVIAGIVGAVIGAVSALRPEKTTYVHTELSMVCTSPSGKDYTFRLKCDGSRIDSTDFMQVLRKNTF